MTPGQNPRTRIAVIGLGYIGLPTATILATHGAQVIGVDTKTATVEAVNEGRVPFVEPDLEVAVAAAVGQARLAARHDVPEADVFIIAVPTPVQPDHDADLSYIDAATDAVAPMVRDGNLVILESTSPPGTTAYMAERLLRARPDLGSVDAIADATVHFAHCPERVLPGRVMVELVSNDRVVGGLTPKATELARAVYATFCAGELVETDATTAELSKLAENAFRDVNIAFANELSMISDRLGVDVWELIALANRHPRVNILQPGPGVGGHCIAVDPWFIVHSAPEDARLIRTAREVNDAKPQMVVDAVVEKVKGLAHPRIAALGLAFKPDIDDLRSSPAMTIVTELAKTLSHATITAVEPHIDTLPSALASFDNVCLDGLEAAVADADAVVLLVDHTAFKSTGPDRLGLDPEAIIDTRGTWRN